jgi:outer membrane protein OmpA-like peptidoglycan-associated protein
MARSPAVDERETTAIILFPRGESELAAHLSSDVDELFERLGSSSLASVLVLGFASEHDDLSANLALAERRAQGIARELVTRGVPRDRIVAAGSETRTGDDNGSRVELMIVPGARIAMRQPRN